MMTEGGWLLHPNHTITSKPLLNHLKKRNPSLYKFVLKLPERQSDLQRRYMRLTAPVKRGVFMQQLSKQKKSVQQKFEIIKQSIDQRDSCSRTNEQIMKECQNLKIKNVARKYSEYKLKEGLEEMQKKIKLQKRHRCLTQNWAAAKKTRAKSCSNKKQADGKDESLELEVQQTIVKYQARANTEGEDQLRKSGSQIDYVFEQEDSHYSRAKLVITSSFERLRQLTAAGRKQQFLSPRQDTIVKPTGKPTPLTQLKNKHKQLRFSRKHS